VSVFFGTYEHSIDDKGRLAIPARFRGELAQGLFVTRGFDRCVMALKPEDFERLRAYINGLPIFQTDARQLQRLMFSQAWPLQPDRLGRVVIPQLLRDYASLNGDVIVAGISSRIEIWDRTAWMDESVQAESRAQELAEHLAGLDVL
jgi:MraZ protein